MYRDLNGVLWIEVYRTFPTWTIVPVCGLYTDFKFEFSQCRIDDEIVFETEAPNISYDGQNVTIYISGNDTVRFSGTYTWKLTAKKAAENILINSGKIRFV